MELVLIGNALKYGTLEYKEGMEDRMKYSTEWVGQLLATNFTNNKYFS